MSGSGGRDPSDMRARQSKFTHALKSTGGSSCTLRLWSAPEIESKPIH